jgi:hypothetical protein
VVLLQKALSGLLVVLVCVAVVGCGGSVKRVTVTGKIVDGGKPLALTGRDYQEGAASVEVRFYPDDEALVALLEKLPVSLSASAKQDGTFVIDGGDGKGIPVGKYKVAVTNRNMNADRRNPAAGQGDVWGGKFSADKTPFKFDIQDAQEIVLDIAQAAAPAAKP